MIKDKYQRWTAMNRSIPSKPYRTLLEKGLIKGRVLDYGCGRGMDVQDLESKNFTVYGFDPAHFPIKPKGKFNTILATYVLNIILHPLERINTIKEIQSYLRKNGNAYVTVRRDVPREGTFSQRWIELPFVSEHKTSAFEIYRIENI